MILTMKLLFLFLMMSGQSSGRSLTLHTDKSRDVVSYSDELEEMVAKKILDTFRNASDAGKPTNTNPPLTVVPTPVSSDVSTTEWDVYREVDSRGYHETFVPTTLPTLPPISSTLLMCRENFQEVILVTYSYSIESSPLNILGEISAVEEALLEQMGQNVLSCKGRRQLFGTMGDIHPLERQVDIAQVLHVTAVDSSPPDKVSLLGAKNGCRF